jgi:preprotein translocase subunit YajC
MGDHPMLESGDRVIIDGGPLAGTVQHVHPHEAIVEIDTAPASRRAASRSSRYGVTLR